MKLSRLLLASSSLVLVNFIGATTMNTTITVTTLVDENGENPSACSLREAIKANNDVLPFGGCTPGDRYLTNTILLPKGTITLTGGVLKSTRPIKISGADPDDHEAINPFTYNTRTRLGVPVSTIDGNGARILDTTGGDSSLELQNVNIRNGKGDRGGAILAGGTVTATRTLFVNNTATGDGGAIYMSGPNSTVTLQTTQFEGNDAPRGAAMAMSCKDNLVDTSRVLDIVNTSFIRNGSDNSVSVVESCGNGVVNFKNSTFGENPLPAVTNGQPAGIIRIADRLGASNALSLSQVTAIKNGKATGNAASFLLYNNISKITILQSVLAFNRGSACKSVAAGDTTSFDGNYNVLENCNIPNLLTADRNTADITGKGVNVDNEFEQLDYYGGVVQVYLPKAGSQYIVDKGPSSTACADGVDQRGAVRNASMTCDIGSVERRQLVSTEDLSSKNQTKAGRVVIADVLVNDIPDESVAAGVWDVGGFNDAAPAWPTVTKALADGKINRNPKKFSLIPSPTTAKENCASLDVLGIVDGFLDRAIQSTDTTVRAGLASSLEKLRKTMDKADAIDDINNLLSHADKQGSAAVAAKAAALRAKLTGTTIDIDVLNGLIDLADAIIAANEATRAAADTALNTAMLAGNQSLATQKNTVIQDMAKDTGEVITLKRAFMNRTSPIFDAKAVNAVAAIADGLLAADAKTRMTIAAELQAARDANNQTLVNQKTAELTAIDNRIKSTKYNQTLLLSLKPSIGALGDFMLQHEMLYFRYVDPTYLPPSGNDNQCHYRIGYPAAAITKTSNESSMHVAVENVPPTATPDTVILPYGNATVSMDLLANDDDNGDNFFDANDKAIPGPGGFYTDNAGSLNIRVTVEPKLGYLTADASGPCPDNSTTITKTCYHGTITYHSNNILAPFSDSFSYQVIDKDMTSSGEAKVNILNTDSPEYKKMVGDTSGDSSHGGSVGFLGLLGLTALGILRHRSMNRRNP